MPYTGWQSGVPCADCGTESVLAECDHCGKRLCLPCVNVQNFIEEKQSYECDTCLAKREQFEDHKEVIHEG